MEFQKTPGWLDWYSGPSKPKFKLPAGAVDAHCHVFGPGAEFPYAPERKYTPTRNAPVGAKACRTSTGTDTTFAMAEESVFGVTVGRFEQPTIEALKRAASANRPAK